MVLRVQRFQPFAQAPLVEALERGEHARGARGATFAGREKGEEVFLARAR